MNQLQAYLLDVVERAGKTGVQAALLAIGAETITNFNILAVNWLTVGEFAAGGFVLSALTSLASGAIPLNGTASLVPAIQIGTTLKKASKTVAPKTVDGEEYTTYQGIPDETGYTTYEGVTYPDDGPETTVANPEPVAVDTVTPPTDGHVTIGAITNNADGTVTIDGVVYTHVG